MSIPNTTPIENTKVFKWTVIGAGPAGIATIGKLIDNHINPEEIAWIDPNFEVGDFGTKWRHVASNTKIDLFLKFFNACQAFHYASCKEDFAIHHRSPEETCLLELAAQPLLWITQQLKNLVYVKKDYAKSLKLYNRQWEITLTTQKIYSKNVILAIGSKALSLNHNDINPKLKTIPLDVALNPELLQANCQPNDIIAVFGSSHSAIIILKTLLEQCQIQKVINFYLSPLKYAIQFDNWTLFDDTGLKASTAEWARNHIDGIPPKKLQRLISNQSNTKQHLAFCNKVIYATGFQARHIIIEDIPTITYNNKNGIIAPGLFGVGIAFPENKTDRYGHVESRVGLWKFMEYINTIMPIWLNYSA